MKKRITALIFAFLLVTAAGCGKQSDNEPSRTGTSIVSSSSESNDGSGSCAPSSAAGRSQSEDESAAPSPPAEDQVSDLMIQISDGIHTVTFQLNDSKAAKDLYAQLPLSLPVEDYGDNEKIFYPPEALDVADTPKAGGGVGTLAYYSPWADVVLFFGSYSPNGSLYELGQVVSGSDQIRSLKGTITIEAAS